MRKTKLILQGRSSEYVQEGKGVISCLFIGPWEIYAPTFPSEFKDLFTVYSLDFPWVTHSEFALTARDVSKITSIEDLLKLYYEFVTSLDLSNLVIVGSSALGLVSAEFARLYPERVAGVVMLATPLSMEGLPKARENFLKANYEPGLFPRLATRDSRRQWRDRVRRKTAYEKAKDRGFSAKIDGYLAELMRDEPSYYLKPELAMPMYDAWRIFNIPMREQLFHILSRFDAEPLATLECPVFDALGLHDGIIPPYIVTDYPKKPTHLSYHIFDEAAHFPHYEMPKEFMEQLAGWLKGLKSLSSVTPAAVVGDVKSEVDTYALSSALSSPRV